MSSDSAAPVRQHYNITFAIVAIGALTYTLLQSMLIPALPDIQRELQTSQANVSWVFTAFLLSASIATPVLGRLGDMFGKKKMLVAVFVAVVIGAVVAALATTIGMMIVARAIQGLGGAVFPLAFGIIRDEFPRERVAGAIGGISAILGVGSGLGIVLAGPIVEHLSYHWLFWIPGIVAVVTTLATLFFVPESQVRTPGSVNFPAVIGLSGWLVALLLGVSQGENWGWDSARIVGLFVAAVVLFVAWVQIELRSKEPLVDVRMLRIPAVWWTNVSALLFGFGMYSMMVVLPAFMQTPESAGYGFGATTTGAGLAMLPSTIAMLVVGMLIGRVTTRFGSKVPLVAGGLVSALAWVILVPFHDSLWQIYVAVAIAGLGMGLAFSAMTNLVVEAVPMEQTGVATGMNANIRTIGGSIGSQVVSTVIVSGAAASGLPKEAGYVNGMIIMGVALGAAGLVALLIPHAGRRKLAEPIVHDELSLAADATILAASLDAGEAFAGHAARR